MAEPTGLEPATSDVTGQVYLGHFSRITCGVSNLKNTWTDAERHGKPPLRILYRHTYCTVAVPERLPPEDGDSVLKINNITRTSTNHRANRLP